MRDVRKMVTPNGIVVWCPEDLENSAASEAAQRARTACSRMAESRYTQNGAMRQQKPITRTMNAALEKQYLPL